MPDSFLDVRGRTCTTLRAAAVSRSAIFSVPLLLCFLAGQIKAENTDWAAVQALPAGQHIQIVLRTGRTMDGAMERVTAETIDVRHKSGTLTARRPEISRVYRVKSAHRAKWALIGAAVGAGVGGAVGAATLEHEIGYAGAMAGAIVLFAAVGAGVGCIIGRQRAVLIYSTPLP
jgi:hypothetical protein